MISKIRDATKALARLIKKIYEIDPLTCPKCGGDMRIIAFIEDYNVIKKILDWLSIDDDFIPDTFFFIKNPFFWPNNH